MSKGLKFPVIVHPLRFLPRWLMWIGSRDTVRSTRDSCRTKCPNKRRKTPCLNHSQSLSAFDVFGQCPKCCTTVLERPSDFDHRLSADGPNLGGLNSRGVLCINAMSPFLHIQIAVTAVYKSYKNAWNNSDSNQCTRVRSQIDDFPETGQIRITTFKYAKKTSTNFCKWISLEILKYLKNFPASCLSATLPQLPRLQLVEPREGSLQRTSCVSYVFGQLYDKHDIDCRHCIIINHKF